MGDSLKSKMKNSVFLLASVEGDKVSLLAGVTADLTQTLKAGDLIRSIAPLVGGKGGGRPDMAQGGGTNPEALPDALKAVRIWVTETIEKQK